MMAAIMAERHIPGAAIAVVQGGRIVLARNYGVGSVELETPVAPGSVFLLASVTNTFTALGVLLLAEEGKLALDSTIGRYLAPIPPQWNGITVRHLLTHSAGLRDRFEGQAGRFFMDYTTGQMRQAAEATPVDTTPGARFQYSDQGYFLLGQVIEKISGQAYRQFLQERIFRPAGMTSSTTLDQREIVKGRVPSYLLRQGSPSPAPRSYQFGLVSHFGILTTSTDLARYAIALMRGSIGTPRIREQMWTLGVLPNGKALRVASVLYGLGWFLEPFAGHRAVYHAGSTGTGLYLAPDDSLAVVVLTNLEQVAGSDPVGIARDIAAVYATWLRWMETPARPDPDPAFTERVKGQLWAVASGQADSTAYSAGFWRSLRPSLPAQRRGLEQYGPPRALIHLSTDAIGTEWLVQWRAEYAELMLLVKGIRDSEGRIDYLVVRQ
jgi:CubicO group peptidase (beta-lactamase class C family)